MAHHPTLADSSNAPAPPVGPSPRRQKAQRAALVAIAVAFAGVSYWAAHGTGGPSIVPARYVVDIVNTCGPGLGAKLSDDPMSTMGDGRPEVDLAVSADVPPISEGTTTLERPGRGDPQDDQLIVVRFDASASSPSLDGIDGALPTTVASFPMSDQVFDEVDGVMRTTFELGGPRCAQLGE